MRAFMLLLVVGACASHPTIPPQEPQLPTSTGWFNEVAEPSKDAVLTIHTSALLKDKVYAPLVHAVFRAMTEQALHAGTDMTVALEASDEIVVVTEGSGDPVLMLRGAPASLDPTSISGLDGSSQWKVSAAKIPHAQVYEFVPQNGALFVLMDRTWIVTAGEGEQRVRIALSRAQGRPVSPDTLEDASIPISLRVPGVAMEKIASHVHVNALKPLFEELRDLRVTLHVNVDDKARARDDVVTAELAYSGVAQASLAEETARDVVGAFGRRGGPRWEWLKDAVVARTEQHVTVKAPLPKWAIVQLGDMGTNLF